jgi:hypothetical protein
MPVLTLENDGYTPLCSLLHSVPVDEEGPSLFVNSNVFVNIAHLHTHTPLECP